LNKTTNKYFNEQTTFCASPSLVVFDFFIMGASHTTLASGGLDDGGMPDLSVARIGGTGSSGGGGGGDSDPRTNATTSSTNFTSTITSSTTTMTGGGGGGGRGSDGGSGGGGAGSSNDLADHYVIEHHLFPGSGRMMRTMTCRHKKHGSFMILKSMWVSRDRWEELKQAQVELQRIQQALQGTIHLAPFCHWSVGDYRIRGGSTSPVCPVYLARPYFYTTLSDRLASRPFLTPVEKLWIIYQLLQALDAMHSRGVVHGFLTTENIGLSSWNWVVLVDLASSHKARTALPDDDPSEYLYYFQELYYTQQQQHAPGGGTTGAGMDDWNNPQQRHQHHHSGRSREKRCYLAPERFHTSSVSSSTPGTATSSSPSSPPPLTPAMDIFSAGCVIMETFLNGERALDLGDLMEYRNQQHHIHHHDDDPHDDDTPTTPTNTPPPLKNVQTSSTSSSGSTTSTTRSSSGLTPSLQQKLNKIEFSAVRAACKHMIQLDPSQRLDAGTYLERLQAKLETSSSSSSSVPQTLSSPAQQQQLIPQSFDNVLAPLMERVTYCATPDARLAIAASHFYKVLWETMGIRDDPAKEYMEQLLGATMVRLEEKIKQMKQASGGEQGAVTDATTRATTPQKRIPQKAEEDDEEEKKSSEPTDLFAETAALLRQLESLTFDIEDLAVDASRQKSPQTTTRTASTRETTPENKRKDVSPMSKSSLLIYLQLILSTVPHVQRPASKLVALQLMSRLAHHSSDEARLQRIVPSTVSLLQDQDPLVRASAIQVLAHTLSIIETFPPSDSNVFPQYIFKRVTHMITDPSLVVRVAFAESVPVLAETSHRFLDISHAVRLYEAVGGGTGGGNSGGCTGTTTSSSASLKDRRSAAANRSDTVFGDDIAKLLDDSTESRSVPTKKDSFPDVLSTIKDPPTTTTTTSASEAVASAAGRTLISSTYNSELAALHETVSRWVVHITTDQSEHSSPPKRALLGDLARLCNFFGLDGVMAFILPQILSFLNDRKDWQLRATLFEVLPSVCQMIGRAATEHFVLPCLETALVDSEEPVICRALRCLSELLELGLLSRSALIGGVAVDSG
jgi:phosphoinositide-3-kinase, regulatory subunit 4